MMAIEPDVEPDEIAKVLRRVEFDPLVLWTNPHRSGGPSLLVTPIEWVMFRVRLALLHSGRFRAAHVVQPLFVDERIDFEIEVGEADGASLLSLFRSSTWSVADDRDIERLRSKLRAEIPTVVSNFGSLAAFAVNAKPDEHDAVEVPTIAFADSVASVLSGPAGKERDRARKAASAARASWIHRLELGRFAGPAQFLE